MANRPVLRRRGVAPAAPAPVAEKSAKVKVSKPVAVEEDEIDEEEMEDVEDEEVVDEDDDEEEEPVITKPAAKKAAPAPVAKKAVVAAPAPAPVKAKKTVAPPPADEDEDEPVVEKKTVKVKPVEATVAGANMLELLNSMAEDSTIVITRTADNKWLFGSEKVSNGSAKSNGVRGKSYWQEVLDPAYQAWDAEWHNLTIDERIKKAKKANVSWLEDKDPRVNIMRCTEAYRTALGIEKYKPQYRTRSDRAKLRG